MGGPLHPPKCVTQLIYVDPCWRPLGILDIFEGGNQFVGIGTMGKGFATSNALGYDASPALPESVFVSRADWAWIGGPWNQPVNVDFVHRAGFDPELEWFGEGAAVHQ